MSAPVLTIRDPRERPLGEIPWLDRLGRLREWFRAQTGVVVAYSGGVDSSLALAVAVQELGERALGVIGRSDSYAARELDQALAQAAAIGARIEVVATGELSDPDFRSNPVDRCYHCKDELYGKLAAIAAGRGALVVDGTIVDDLADWRPGRLAGSEHDVRSPLAALGFRKDDVRAAASHLGLASAGKAASPCLASRIPHGTEITREALSAVERAEDLLISLGFEIVRVRHHGDVARIEIPGDQISSLLAEPNRTRVASAFKALGFRYITVDLEGFRSGSLNPTVAATPVKES